MKKIISWVITIAMLLSVMPMAAFAAWGTDDKPVATLSVEGVDGADTSMLIPGKKVQVSFVISGLNKYWNGYSFQLNYDSDVFALNDIEEDWFDTETNCAALTDLFGDPVQNIEQAGKLILTGSVAQLASRKYKNYLIDPNDADEKGTFKDLTVLTATFTVKESAPYGDAEFSVATSSEDGATPYRLAFTQDSGYEAVTTSTDDLKESVTVVETNSLTITGGADSIAAPNADGSGDPGSTDITFVATVIGSDGNVVSNPNVTWAVSPADDGVSVNDGVSVKDGVVTVKSNAAAGEYKLTATATQTANAALSADASASVPFNVTKEPAELTRVAIGDGQGSIGVPTASVVRASTAPFTAVVYDQYGAAMSDQTITWSVSNVPGVSIENGVVTVTNEASAGDVTVTATCGTVSSTVGLTISKADPVATTVQVSGGKDTIAVPTAEDYYNNLDVSTAAFTAAFTATVYDQYGAEMSNPEITWSVTEATGVSIDSSGVVTVTNKASAGTVTVTAACGDQTGTATLTITKEPSRASYMRTLSGGSEISGTDNIGIPGSKAYTVEVFDQYGDVMEDATVTLTLSNEAEGFKIEGNVVTVADTTADGATADLTVSVGSISDTFTITAKQVAVDWSGIALKNPAQITYGDSKASAFDTLPETGTATAYVNNVETTINGTFAIKDADKILSAGEQSVVVVFTVTSDGTYTNNTFEKTYPVTVQPKPVAVEWSNTTLTYDGAEQKPSAQVTQGLVGSDTLDVAVSGGQTAAGQYTATASITNGNYKLTNPTTTYTIAPKSVTVNDGTYAVSKVYDGNTNAAATGALSLTGVLTGDTVTVSGTIGTYADKNVGSSKTVTVSNLALGGDDASNYTLGDVTSYKFTNATITPATVTVASGITAADKTYNADTDASLDCTGAVLNGKIAGDSLSVTATGAFADKAVGTDKTVTISNLALTGDDAGNYVLAESGNQSATTADITPYTLTVKDGTVAVTKEYDTTTDAGTLTGALALDGVFAGDTVSVAMDKVTAGAYPNSTVGTYTVTLTLGDGFLTGDDAGNYTVASSYDFSGARITKQNQDSLSIVGATDVYYGGDSITITVTGGSGVGAYSLTSSDPSVLKLTPVENENAAWTAEILKVGTVTLTANKAGDDNYEPATAETATVTVCPKPIAVGDFTFDLSAKTYTGSAIEPAVTSTALTAGRDYTVTYSENVNAGEGTITVEGKGNYTGTVTQNFQINPKSIADMTVSTLKDSYTYTGSAIVPTVTVTDGSVKLVAGRDYNVAYSGDIINVGTATITVTGQGNYTGTADTTFEIVAAPASGTVTITGTNYLPGETLGIYADGNYDSRYLSWQWYNQDGAIEGATSDTYTLQGDDTSVYVVLTSSGNYVGTLKSEPVEVGKTPLPDVVDVSFTDVDNDGANGVGDTVEITVDPSLNDDDYTIVWLRDGVAIPGASERIYTIAKEDLGKSISVKIVAKGDTYTGEMLAVNPVPVAAVEPDAPVLKASAGNQKVTLSWTAPFDGGSTLTGYSLTVAPAPDGSTSASYLLGADVTSFEVTGLTNGTEYTFTLIASNDDNKDSDAGVVKATPKAPTGGGGGGSAVATYTLTFDTNGGSAVAKVTKTSGVTVDLSKYTSTKDGYTFGGWYSDKALTNPVTSVKLDKNLTVYAKWIEQPATGGLPFTDVAENDWFFASVSYVYEAGIMNGVSATTFAPQSLTTRGQIVTMLYRLAGSPAVSGASSFADVSADAYYASPVAWAAANGIVNGYDAATFGPDGNVTREQLAAILYRYAQDQKADVSQTADLSGFADAASVSDYAVSAMQWAVGAGIVNGRGENLLAPRGTATRAEVATMLMRFIENVL